MNVEVTKSLHSKTAQLLRQLSLKGCVIHPFRKAPPIGYGAWLGHQGPPTTCNRNINSHGDKHAKHTDSNSNIKMASQKEENIKDLVANAEASSTQEESHAQLSKTLSNKLSNLNLKVPSLSSVALKGDESVSQ